MPTATTYAYHFKKALKDAAIVKPDGSPKCTPHGLRQFFASTAHAAGIPIHEVSRRLGHESIKTTVDVYGISSPPHGTAAGPSCRLPSVRIHLRCSSSGIIVVTGAC
ncbi:tyrosine-type recombinase/integrase [Streptomyces sp. NPDC001450]